MDIKKLDERLISNLESFEESLTVFDELQNDVEKMSEDLKGKSIVLDEIKLKYSKEVQAYKEELQRLNRKIKEQLLMAEKSIEKISEEGDSVLSYIKLQNEKLQQKVDGALLKLNNIFSEEIEKFTKGLSSLDEKTEEDIRNLSSHLQQLNKTIVENTNAEIANVKVSISHIIEGSKKISEKLIVANEEVEKLKGDLHGLNKQTENLEKVSNEQKLHIINLENKLRKSSRLQCVFFIVLIILIVVARFA